MGTVLTIAHRGALRAAPENTLPAIEKAIQMGAEVISLEVQGTLDHRPVLFADTRLERTTNGTGRVDKISFEQLKTLDAGSWFSPEFKEVQVPGLDEGLKAIPQGVGVFLVLPPLAGPGPLFENILAALKTRSPSPQDVLAFPNSETLNLFREKLPESRFCMILGEKIEGWVVLQKALKFNLPLIRPWVKQIDAGLTRKAHEKGLQVWAYFADEEEEMERLVEKRVDGIVTGRPERLKKVLSPRAAG